MLTLRIRFWGLFRPNRERVPYDCIQYQSGVTVKHFKIREHVNEFLCNASGLTFLFCHATSFSSDSSYIIPIFAPFRLAVFKLAGLSDSSSLPMPFLGAWMRQDASVSIRRV
jgi:hypothetical protein